MKQVWCAAITGPDVDFNVLRMGIAAFKARPDIEILERNDPRSEVEGSVTNIKAGMGAHFEIVHPQMPHAIARITDLTRTIAVSTGARVHACFSGYDPDALVPDYQVLAVEPDGRMQHMELPSADRFLREHPHVSSSPKEELWELLYEQVADLAPRTDDSTEHRESLVLAYRLKSTVDDPRLAELIFAASSAPFIEMTEQSDGRFLLRLTAADGSRRLAYLSKQEAIHFKR